MNLRFLLFIAVASLLCASRANAGDFALRDGDTLVFLGDSITAARGYPKIVENYTLMRFPARRVRFVNAGQGGDTASGAVERLERDVFSKGATVVTVVFGVNDIGWGMKADAEHKQKYLEGIRTIIERCREKKVRPIICSPAITAEAPDKAEEGFLQKMTDEGLALAKSLGAETVDLQRGMREVQRRIVAANANEPDKAKQTRLHVEDGVHLNDLGQLAMAYALLKGLGAPENVSAATLDAKKEGAAAPSAEGCTISDVKLLEDGIAFTRLDEALPLNLGVFSALNYRWVPIPDGINRYRLTVTNLPAGEYEIRAEGRLLGKANAGQLARGMNLASMTGNGWEPGGPWNAQSDIVKELVDARDRLWFGGVQRAKYLPTHPDSAGLDDRLRKLDDDFVAAQRAIAKPYAYHFEIHRVTTK
jgi:lysophospholipase L1-like esterase